MADWEAYDRIVEEQQAQLDKWYSSDEGQAYLAERDYRTHFIHDYIDAAPDHARGYYLGLVKGLLYANALSNTDVYSVEIPLDDAGYGYSPSGQQQHAEHFYAPEPAPAPDLVHHAFDPVLFLCIAKELDEAGCNEWSFELVGDEPWGRIRITAACTETGTGIPSDFDAWYAWEQRTQGLRDHIAKPGPHPTV